jgi:hypothetical protein
MTFDNDDTTILVTKHTVERLNKLKKLKTVGKAESYDDVINRILDERSNKNE